METVQGGLEGGIVSPLLKPVIDRLSETIPFRKVVLFVAREQDPEDPVQYLASISVRPAHYPGMRDDTLDHSQRARSVLPCSTYTIAV